MFESAKRFLHSWWTPAIFLLLCGLVAGLAAIGRRGTLVGRYERITDGIPEADVLATLGPPRTTKEADFPDRTLLDPMPPEIWTMYPEALEWYFQELTKYPLHHGDDPVITRTYTWQEGPAEVWMVMMRRDRGGTFPNWSGGWVVAKRRLQVDEPSVRHSLWHFRRWAEQAWKAWGMVGVGQGLMLAAIAALLVELASTLVSMWRRPPLRN